MLPIVAIVAYTLAALVLVAVVFSHREANDLGNPGEFIAAVALWPILAAYVGVMTLRDWWERRD